MSHITIAMPVTALGVLPKGKMNRFDEDVGQLVAINEKSEFVRVKFKQLLTDLNVMMDKPYNSIAKKTAFLEDMKAFGYLPKISISIKGSFKEFSKDDSFAVFYSLSKINSRNHNDNLQVTLPKVAHPRIGRTLTLADPKQEMQIAYSFYDKLVALFSYSQSGYKPIVNNTSYFQLIPNGVPVDLEAFSSKPPITPLTPQGDFTTTEEFATIASMTFDTNGKTTIQNVDSAFGNVIKVANCSVDPNDKSVKILNKAKAYLFHQRKVKNPFTDEEKIISEPSADYTAYQTAIQDLTDAYTNYISTKNSLDLNKPDDQRKWQAESGKLQRAIDQANNNVSLYPYVKQALEILVSYGNNAAREVIKTSKELYLNSQQTSQITQGGHFHISFGSPSNWYAKDSGYSSFDFKTTERSEHSSESATSYGGGGSFSFGLFSTGGSFHESDTERRSHIETNDFRFTFKVGTIPIIRPWMDTTLFSLENWSWGGESPGRISSGNFPSEDADINKRTLPYYSTALVIAKDITISGNWSKSDEKIMSHSLDTEASVGFGPFSIKGSYSEKTGSRDFQGSFSDGTFKVPGAQIIGVINTIVPFSAPK